MSAADRFLVEKKMYHLAWDGRFDNHFKDTEQNMQVTNMAVTEHSYSHGMQGQNAINGYSDSTTY